MLLSIQKPDADRLQTFLEEHGDAPFSYPEVGQSLDGSPAGYDVDFHEIRLGEGREVFEKAAAALKNWQQFPAGWCFIGPGEPPVKVGQVVAMSARVLGVWFSNLAKIVYLVEEENRSGFAYGTLDAHVERGEEVFLVEQRGDGSVWYVIRAFSRPRFWAARLNYPFARDLQKNFVADTQRAMLAEVGGEATGSKSTVWSSGWLIGLIGFAAWLMFLKPLGGSLLSDTWGMLILGFAMLVCAPMAFELAERMLGRSAVSRAVRGGQRLALGFLLVPLVPLGWLLLFPWLCIGWVGITFLTAGWGLGFLLFEKRPGGFWEKLPRRTVAFGLAFLAVGGGWLCFWMLAAPPFGFDIVIASLTAIHFHFAGLVLPILTGLAAEKLPGPLARAACLGVLTGVPLTAMGITASQFGQKLPGNTRASWMATVGMLVVVLHGKLAVLAKTSRKRHCSPSAPRRWLRAWGWLFCTEFARFTPSQASTSRGCGAVHGTLNSLGFAGLGLAGWMHFARRSR